MNMESALIDLLANLQHKWKISFQLTQSTTKLNHPLKALYVDHSSRMLLSYLLLVDERHDDCYRRIRQGVVAFEPLLDLGECLGQVI